MKRLICTTAVAVLLWLAGEGSVTAFEFTAPEKTVPGGTVSVAVPGGAAVQSLQATLLESSGKPLVEARGFPVDPHRVLGSWAALIGVPSTAEPGAYRIRVSIQTASGRVENDSAIQIESRSFKQENIGLDKELSVLQTEETPLKMQQARELWHILTSFNPGAVYQTGPLVVPVSKYIVTSPFGERRLFVFTGGGDQRSVHQGIDLAVPAGTPIVAAGAGKVVFVGSWLMTGNTVVIEQLPGVYSLYYHMERALVKKDEIVKQGEKIGLVGSTGLATGPHLHWQVDVGGVAVDPMLLAKTGLIQPEPIAARVGAHSPPGGLPLDRP